MKINRRKFYYILTAFVISIFALYVGMDFAFVARGYFAFGGEWLAPFYVGGAAYIVYSRDKIREKLKEFFENEQA